jgi:hypothetical protein
MSEEYEESLRCANCYKEMTLQPGWPMPDRAFCSGECLDEFEEKRVDIE